MVNGILSSLERHLANEYRARNSMCSGRAIRIDDQDGDDQYPHFCTIRVEVNEAGDGFELSLNNLPWNSDLEDFIDEIAGEWRDTPTGRNLTISLTTKSVPVIRKLAKQTSDSWQYQNQRGRCLRLTQYHN